MSFSFYGGPKGQDFNISRVFNNRSHDLLEDLKMRWYSPVNVGDYVFISYGDIHAQDKYVTVSNNNIIQVPSTFNKNLNIDYYPTNFIVDSNGVLFYIDFECNNYMEEWNFENWGIKYWSKTQEYLDTLNKNME